MFVRTSGDEGWQQKDGAIFLPVFVPLCDLANALLPFTGWDRSPLRSTTTSGQAAWTTSGAAAERRDPCSLWCWHLCLPRALPPCPRGPEGQGKTACSGWGVSSAMLFGLTLREFKSGSLTYCAMTALVRRIQTAVWSGLITLASELPAFSCIFQINEHLYPIMLQKRLKLSWPCSNF